MRLCLFVLLCLFLIYIIHLLLYICCCLGYKLDRFRIHEGYADPDEDNVLDFNEMLVVNALNYCTSPYNKYGAVENIITACHCDVPHASADIEHQYHTVEESGVLKQTMFTFEEAKREMEEEKYIGQFCKLAAAETKSKCCQLINIYQKNEMSLRCEQKR